MPFVGRGNLLDMVIFLRIITYSICSEKQCENNQIPCASGKCIPGEFLCDGEFDCGFGDYSDELECSSSGNDSEICSAVSHFKCGDGKCISRIYFCDGKFDCEDKSDEDQCTCRIDQFTCADSTCISRKERIPFLQILLQIEFQKRFKPIYSTHFRNLTAHEFYYFSLSKGINPKNILKS